MSLHSTDVTEYYQQEKAPRSEWAIKAERCGANVLILWPGTRDDLESYYELSYHWLTSESAELCEVQGSEVSLWDAESVNLSDSLFSQFNLF